MIPTTADTHLPPALRARLAADYTPVQRLRHPVARALTMAPVAAMALLAAPWWFELRLDAARLGWTHVWGWSVLQSLVGVVMVSAALHEAVPGRTWRRGALLFWLMLPVGLVALVTWTTYGASPTRLGPAWAVVGVMCLGGSLATALPAAALASVLAARAYPTRPAVTGLLSGLGAGLMGDAGWRLFCHFSDPTHVLSAHLAAVATAGLCGAALARLLHRQRRSARSAP